MGNIKVTSEEREAPAGRWGSEEGVERTVFWKVRKWKKREGTKEKKRKGMYKRRRRRRKKVQE